MLAFGIGTDNFANLVVWSFHHCSDHDLQPNHSILDESVGNYGLYCDSFDTRFGRLLHVLYQVVHYLASRFSNHCDLKALSETLSCNGYREHNFDGFGWNMKVGWWPLYGTRVWTPIPSTPARVIPHNHNLVICKETFLIWLRFGETFALAARNQRWPLFLPFAVLSVPNSDWFGSATGSYILVCMACRNKAKFYLTSLFAA